MPTALGAALEERGFDSLATTTLVAQPRMRTV